MGIEYREHSGPPALGRWVECLWAGTTTEAIRARPVRPDGCLDIVYSAHNGLQAVGTMSTQQCFDMPAGSFTAGVRFRPGMAGAFLAVAAAELTDRTVSLGDLRGKTARTLERRLQDASSVDE